MDQSLNMVKIAYDALDDKLAEDIKIIDIRSISVLADYFIIARDARVQSGQPDL